MNYNIFCIFKRRCQEVVVLVCLLGMLVLLLLSMAGAGMPMRGARRQPEMLNAFTGEFPAATDAPSSVCFSSPLPPDARLDVAHQGAFLLR